MSDVTDTTERVNNQPRARAKVISLIGAGSSQFAAQALGIVIAVAVSHLIARRLGVGSEADAFLLGRRLVTSVTEALNQVVVVVFIPLIASQAAAGSGFAVIIGRTSGAALALGAILTAVFVVGAPTIVYSVAPGFNSATAEMAIQVIRVLALALPATVATIAFAAYCNVRGRFGAPTVIRQAPRVAVALALLLASGSIALKAAAAYTAATVVVAGLTLLFALWLAGKNHISEGASPTRDAAVQRRGAAAIALTLGALACVWLETTFAARQGVGGVAMLDFSQRLGALCGNTLAMALGLVIFADLAGRAARGETADLGRRFKHATLTGIALLAPMQIGLFVNAEAVVDLIIAHGEFSTAAVAQLVSLLQWMTLAPFGALVTRMMLVRVLAEQDLPLVRLVGAGMTLDFLSRLALFGLLTPVMGLLALPVSLAIAPVVPILFLRLAMQGRGVFTGPGAFLAAAPILAASTVSCLAIAAGAAAGPPMESLLLTIIGDMDKLGSIAQLLTSGLAGGVALAFGLKLFRVKLKPQ